MGGGTLYADAFGAKRGPTPAQLIEGFKSIAFAAEEVTIGGATPRCHCGFILLSLLAGRSRGAIAIHGKSAGRNDGG